MDKSYDRQPVDAFAETAPPQLQEPAGITASLAAGCRSAAGVKRLVQVLVSSLMKPVTCVQRWFTASPPASEGRLFPTASCTDPTSLSLPALKQAAVSDLFW